MKQRAVLRLVIVLALSVCAYPLQAQVSLGPTGPFDRKQLSSNYPTLFKVTVTDPSIQIENYTFQLYTREGAQTRVLQQQSGTDWQFAVNLLDVPVSPEPQLLAVLTVRHQFSGTRYTITRSLPIRFTDPYQLCEIELPTFRKRYNLASLPVGRQAVHLYALDQQPPNTRQVTLSLVNAKGDTVAMNTGIGNPFLDTLVLLGYGTPNHQGALRLRAHVLYDDGPAEGYFTEVVIPDSIPVPEVTASTGFGPFSYGVEAINTFVVQGLGPACTEVEWGIRYRTASNRQRTPVWIKRVYDPVADSMHIVYNMRDVTIGSELIVRAHFGEFLPSTERTYRLDIQPKPPSITNSSPFPLQLGSNRRDTITIDSLPPRIQHVKLQLTSSSGTPLATNTIRTTGTDYIRKAQLGFDVAPLKAGTYFVRAFCTNDQRDDDPVDFIAFDVRDTTTYVLTARSWGPFTQGDTAVLSVAVTNIRPYSNGDGWDEITGHFVIVDTLQPDVPLFESPAIDLSQVKSQDSILYWPDSSYQFGAAIRKRAEIPTVQLPLSAQVRFERRINFAGRIVRDRSVDHPIIMMPAPGDLHSQPGLDTTFVATRHQPLTLYVTNIIPNATAMRFALLGTSDPEVVIEGIVPRRPGQDSVAWSTDVGVLPVNAKVVVSAITPFAEDLGAQIVRSIHTKPDTLTMTATVPFDVLQLEWNVDPTTQLITGVKPFVDTLTFHRLPAQTRQIVLLSKDDQGQIIDSVLVEVPYRLMYDSTLSVSTPFTFRSFATAELEVRYLSDGGPIDGIQYRKSITSIQQPMPATLRTVDVTAVPPAVVVRPLRQGSSDAAEITLKWGMGKGLSGAVVVDSVVMEVLDCAGTEIDRQLLPVPVQNTATGVITETLYAVSRLPLATSAMRLTMYSTSMTLPRRGASTTIPLTLRTNPQLGIPLGFRYPSYRVNDTTALELRQTMYATNINGIYEIDSLQVVDKNNRVARILPAARPQGDTIFFAEMDFNTLRPENSPYIIRGIIRTRTCAQQPTIVDTLAAITVPGVLSGPPDRNWVYSSKGWGPFQQGRAPATSVIASIEPSWFVTQRGEQGDSLAVSIVGWSNDVGIFTDSTPQGFSYPAGVPLPPVQFIRQTINLNPFDTVSAIGVQVQRFRKGFSGTTKVFDELYTYPVAMLPFPDQPIVADSTGYEQSVLAGTPNASVMKSIYDFRMEAQSIAIDSLKFTMQSSDETVLDGTAVGVQARNLLDSTSIFAMQRNVAPYPWPHVARDRDRVTINVGYQFTGAVKPTKIQKTAISILPRADWLNGLSVRLDGTATDTLIDIAAEIPMPFFAESDAIPLFGRIESALVSSNANGSLTVQASYNPLSGGFTVRNGSQLESFWKPTISLLESANFFVSNTVSDGATFDEFTALYRFEDAPLADNSDTVANRELRIRGLYTAGGGGVVGMVRWLREIGEVIKKLSKATSIFSLTPTFILDLSAKQISTVNLGTEETGTLMHLSEEDGPTPSTEMNEFPTSQGMSWIITGGGGIDASLLGVVGVNASITHNMIMAYGNTYSGSVAARQEKYWPVGRIHENWFNLEMSLFFGLVNIDLYRGLLNHSLQDDNAMPSYYVFSGDWESIFKAGVPEKSGESVQSVQPLARHPQELPFYSSAPQVASDTSHLLALHVEQALIDNSGRLMLSALNDSTRALEASTVIAQNRNGIHDPAMWLIGSDGSAIVAWMQNRFDTRYYGSLPVDQLLAYEEVHAAIYDASTNTVQQLPTVSDPAALVGSVRVAAAPDGASALIVWQTIDQDGIAHIHARPAQRTPAGWTLGPSNVVWSRAGARDVNIAALADGTFMVTCIYDEAGSQPETVAYWIVSASSGKPWERVGIIDESPLGITSSDIELITNGSDVLLIHGTSHAKDSSEFVRLMNIHRYVDGSWKSLGSPRVGGTRGVFRHIKADVSTSGTFFALIDAYDHEPADSARHSVVAVIGSIETAPDQWKVFTNHEVYTEGDRSIWSADASIGHNNVFYIATQELDTIRGNRQQYRNGVALGASRLNTVVRAMKLSDGGDLVGVRFDGTPTTVAETTLDELESSLRYRVRLMNPIPNPTSGMCTVPVSVMKACMIHVRVVDALGRTVASVYNGPVQEGIQGVPFNADALPAGSYHVVVSDNIGVVNSVPFVVLP